MRKFAVLPILLALTICFVAMPATRAARAGGSYDTKSLSNLLLTGDELTAALGPGLSDVVDAPSQTGPVVVGRAYTDDSDGDVISIILGSNDDGSAPDSGQQAKILTGDYVKGAAGGFSNIGNFMDGGPLVQNDHAAFFSGQLQGATYNIAGVSFIRGNVFGVILYATQKDNDGTVLGQVYGTQTNKLPTQ